MKFSNGFANAWLQPLGVSWASRVALLGLAVSPTRFFIDRWKGKHATDGGRGDVLRRWSFGLFWIEALACAILSWWQVATNAEAWWSVSVVLCGYAASRCNEIAYAFYSDAMRHLKQEPPTTDLSPAERIRMTLRSYYGLAFNFAVLYYFLPRAGYLPSSEFLHQAPGGFFDAFYFSGVTLATLGYGDIAPIHPISRALALYEVSLGVLLVVVAIATYVSAPVASSPPS